MPRDPDKPIIGGLDYEALVRVVRLAVTEGLREALDESRGSRPRFIDLAHAHRTYGIAPRTLRQHIRAGRLHGYAPGGTKLLVDVQELEAFIRSAAVDRERDIEAIADEALAELEATKR